MGIEPTDRMFFIRPNGFEDRGPHQECKHFQLVSPGTINPGLNGLFYVRNVPGYSVRVR